MGQGSTPRIQRKHGGRTIRLNLICVIFIHRISYSIYRAQWKMKMWGLCSKTGKKLPVKILKYQGFPFLWLTSLFIHMLHCPVGLLIQNTSWKMKLFRISGQWQQSIKPSMGPSGSVPTSYFSATSAFLADGLEQLIEVGERLRQEWEQWPALIWTHLFGEPS